MILRKKSSTMRVNGIFCRRVTFRNLSMINLKMNRGFFISRTKQRNVIMNDNYLNKRIHAINDFKNMKKKALNTIKSRLHSYHDCSIFRFKTQPSSWYVIESSMQNDLIKANLLPQNKKRLP